MIIMILQSALAIFLLADNLKMGYSKYRLGHPKEREQLLITTI